jgi:hypothetical protein
MKQSTCKLCNQSFDLTEKPHGWMANHSRWCTNNPKRKEYCQSNGSFKAIQAMNLKRKQTGITNQFSKAKLESREIPQHPLKGISTQGRPHTDESKEKIRQKALSSKHRRLKKGTVKYKGILLDSSWELALAIRLDELSINWIRPDPIEWTDKEGVVHNYFPDFYLVDHDVYLDPKNSQAILVQKDKLDVILNKYQNIMIIDTLQKCKDFRI